MRQWIALTATLWCATAAADPAFTTAPLAGALEYCVNTAVNQAKAEEIMAYSDVSIGAFKGVKSLGPSKVGVGNTSANGLTTNEIDAVIKASASKIRRCYQQELEKSPDLGGKIVVQFRIGANGAVVSASIKSTTMKSPPVEACILREIRALAFPAKAVANVSYPFIFSQGR